MADLPAFLDRYARLPFSRPDFDCCMMAASWVQCATGVDPAADLRGRYADARGAARLLRVWGGMELMWRVHMAVAGFNTSRHPVAGDVGVVRDLTGTYVAGIRVGRSWAVKATRGILLEDFPTVVAWSLRLG
jgi:hypothetical protein